MEAAAVKTDPVTTSACDTGKEACYEVDLRAEVLSRPTEAMWEAMRSADIGWYGLQQDANVAKLEAHVAALAGKPAGFFVMTGALANLLALMCLAERGTQVVMERRCHFYWHEENGVPYIMGLATRLIDGGRFGKMSDVELAAVLDERYGYAQVTSVVCLENTHSIAGGCLMTPEQTAELAATAKEHGARSVYLDGARLWNAAVALEVPVDTLLVGVDAAMLSMNKSLGAPVGAVLVGTEDFVAKARFHAKRLGAYSVHRIGFFAAAALVAFDTLDDRIRADHRRAKMLAVGLNKLEGLAVDLETVQTNIVRVNVTAPEHDGDTFVRGLGERGIGARVIQPPRSVKFNTYSEISNTDIERVLEAASDVLNSPPALNCAVDGRDR
jgi:threonine aldolase